MPFKGEERSLEAAGLIKGDKPERPRWKTAAQNIPLTIAQGIMGGGFDEFAAFVGEKTGFPSMPPGQGDYESRLATARARLEEIPRSARIAGEMVGAIAPVMGGIAAVPAKVAQAATRLPGWLRASGLGAGIGGLFGFGSGEGGVEPRLEAAKHGAVGGAIGAPALYLGARAAGGIGKRAAEWYRNRFVPETAAKRTVERAFAGDEIVPQEAARELQQLGPQGTLLDVGGPTVAGVTRGLTVRPGTARANIIRKLEGRSRGEGPRVTRAIEKNIDRRNLYAAEEAFLADQRNRASPLYEQAYTENRSMITPGLQEIVRNPRGKRAMKEAAILIENDITAGRGRPGDKETLAAIRSILSWGGKKKPELMLGSRFRHKRPEPQPEPKPPSLRAWHQAKRGFDALIGQKKYTSEITGRLTPQGRSVDGIRQRMRRELIDATGGDEGAYGRGNAIWSGDADAIQALRLGRKATRRDPERIVRDLADLQSEASREAYRTGFARALKDIVDTPGETASLARRIWWSPRMQRRIRAVLPDEKSYNELARVLSAEMLFGEKAGPILAGSRTTPMAAEAASAEPLGLVGTAAAMAGAGVVGSSGRLIIAGRAANLARRIATGVLGADNPKYYEALAKLLVSTDQKQNQFVLEHLRTLPPPEAVGRLTRALTTMGAVGGAEAGMRAMGD